MAAMVAGLLVAGVSSVTTLGAQTQSQPRDDQHS